MLPSLRELTKLAHLSLISQGSSFFIDATKVPIDGHPIDQLMVLQLQCQIPLKVLPILSLIFPSIAQLYMDESSFFQFGDQSGVYPFTSFLSTIYEPKYVDERNFFFEELAKFANLPILSTKK